MDLNKYETLKERFLKYVKIETRSDEKNESIPSTLTQLEFDKNDCKRVGRNRNGRCVCE